MGTLKRDTLNCLSLKFKCVLNMSLPCADAVQSQIRSILSYFLKDTKKKNTMNYGSEKSYLCLYEKLDVY